MRPLAVAHVGASPVTPTVDPGASATVPGTTVLVASLPALLLTGVVTGAAFALGGALVAEYIQPKLRRRRYR